MATTATRTAIAVPHRTGAKFPFGHLNDFTNDRLAFLLDAVRRDGPIVNVRFGPVIETVVTHPDYTQHILQTNQKNYTKDQHFMRAIRTSLEGDDTLFTSDGAYWLRQRRLMQPAFHRKVIQQFGDMIVRETEAALARWHTQGSKPLEMQAEMMHLTMQVIGRAMFNVDMAQEGETLRDAMMDVSKYIVARTAQPLLPPLWVPIPLNQRFKTSQRYVVAMVNRIINERMAGGEEKGDLLDMLLAARDDEGNTLSRQQLIDETTSIFFAGHETTANTLTWALHLISQHPEIEAELRQEIQTVLGERTATEADSANLPLTRAIVQETLRLYPPGWATSRDAIAADHLGPYPIPAKGHVLINVYGLHRSPDYWDEPERFNPHRFLGEPSWPRFAFIPFGAGPRRCIGESLAMLEATLVLATLYQRATLKAIPTHKVEPHVEFTLRTKGVMMHVSRTRG